MQGYSCYFPYHSSFLLPLLSRVTICLCLLSTALLLASFSFSTIVFFALLHVHLRPLSYINLAADDDEDLGGGKNQSRSSYARPTFIFRVGKEEGRTPQKGGECGARFKEKKRESGGKEKLDCQKKKGGKKRYLDWI